MNIRNTPADSLSDFEHENKPPIEYYIGLIYLLALAIWKMVSLFSMKAQTFLHVGSQLLHMAIILIALWYFFGKRKWGWILGLGITLYAIPLMFFELYLLSKFLRVTTNATALLFFLKNILVIFILVVFLRRRLSDYFSISATLRQQAIWIGLLPGLLIFLIAFLQSKK